MWPKSEAVDIAKFRHIVSIRDTIHARVVEALICKCGRVTKFGVEWGLNDADKLVVKSEVAKEAELLKMSRETKDLADACFLMQMQTF